MTNTLRSSAFLLCCFGAALRGQQSDPASFTVGTATASRGSTATGVLVVAPASDSGLRMPVAVIRGARPGPVVAFVAGSHGTEYTSIVALQRLIPRIDATKLAGTVIIAPLLNIASWEQMTPHINPVDRKGMNGMYPGDSTGTQTQRALAAVTRAIVAPADVVVDLHGGDLDEDLRPYSYWYRGGNASQDSAGLKLALAFGLDHIIVANAAMTGAAAGRSLSGQSLLRGKKVLVAEAGRSGVVAASDIKLLVDGSLNVLGSLGMIARAVHPVQHPIWLASDPRGSVRADSGGAFFATIARDTRVKQGQVIGYTTDYLGHKTGDVKAPVDGLITFIRGVPSMSPRATLVTVLPIVKEPAPYKAP